MKIRSKEFNIHPSCGDCYHSQPPKGHGTILDGKKVRYELEKVKYKGEKIIIHTAKTKIDPSTCTARNPETGKPDLSTGIQYPHHFKDLQVSCIGLHVEMLKEQKYPWIDSHPPCFMKRRYENGKSS